MQVASHGFSLTPPMAKLMGRVMTPLLQPWLPERESKVPKLPAVPVIVMCKVITSRETVVSGC